MKARAVLKYARIAPRKVRLVSDMVRGRPVSTALDVLQFAEKRSAPILSSLIRSAMANAAVASPDVDVDALVIHTLTVDQGPTLRRFTPRAMGRASRINKKTSHVTVVLDDGRV